MLYCNHRQLRYDQIVARIFWLHFGDKNVVAWWYKMLTYSNFRRWLADGNIIFVDFWWFSLLALVSCYTFSIVEYWSFSWTSTARLKYWVNIIMTSWWRHDDIIMTSYEVEMRVYLTGIVSFHRYSSVIIKELVIFNTRTLRITSFTTKTFHCYHPFLLTI